MVDICCSQFPSLLYPRGSPGRYWEIIFKRCSPKSLGNTSLLGLSQSAGVAGVSFCRVRTLKSLPKVILLVACFLVHTQHCACGTLLCRTLVESRWCSGKHHQTSHLLWSSLRRMSLNDLGCYRQNRLGLDEKQDLVIPTTPPLSAKTRKCSTSWRKWEPNMEDWNRSPLTTLQGAELLHWPRNVKEEKRQRKELNM